MFKRKFDDVNVSKRIKVDNDVTYCEHCERKTKLTKNIYELYVCHGCNNPNINMNNMFNGGARPLLHKVRRWIYCSLCEKLCTTCYVLNQLAYCVGCNQPIRYVKLCTRCKSNPYGDQDEYPTLCTSCYLECYLQR